MLRAKMQCNSVTRNADKSEQVVLTPVYEDDGVNKRWSKWTPNGRLELTISADGAQRMLEPGKVYFVDIAEAGE